jgi:hypothetical protein
MAVVVTAVILYLYISLYRRPRGPPFDIVQCSIESLSINILAERQLVIVNEPVIVVDKLLETVFAWQYIWSTNGFIEPRKDGSFAQARSKYTILTCPFWDIELDIATPDEVGLDKKYVKMQLSKNQVAIIPPLWYYRCDKKIKCITLDDPISKLAFVGI